MALSQLMMSHGSQLQSYTFSGISAENNPHAQQFNRLRSFVQDSTPSCKDELEPLLFPMFAYLYLDMFRNGHKSVARTFYSRHSNGFFAQEKLRPLVDSLGGIYDLSDIRKQKSVSQLLENKQDVILSNEALNYLRIFLKNDECTLLLQMLNNHIHITIRESEMSQDIKLDSDSRLSTMPDVASSKSEVNESKPLSAISELEESIVALRKTSLSIPSVSFYSFHNTHQGLCNAEFSNDDAWLAGAFEDSTLQLWSLSSTGQSKPSDAIDDQSGHSSKSRDSPKANISHVHLAGDFIDDVKSKNNCSPDYASHSVLRGHSGNVYSVTFTPDNQYCLSASEDTTVRMWDVKTRHNVACYRGHSYPVWTVKTSPIGGCFASGSKDRCARIWSYERLYPLQTLAGHNQDVDVIQFHPNGSYLASGSCDHTVRLWSVHEGRCMRLLSGHKAPVCALAFSPDGKYLASAGEDKRLRIWDLGAGKVLKDLRGHTDTIYSLCFNKNSSMLISGGADSILRFWDVRNDVTMAKQLEHNNSAELLGAFPTKSSSIHSIVFSSKNFVMAAGNVT